MTLAVLEGYRKLGVGAQLVAAILKDIREIRPVVEEVALHVQISNTAGIKFYMGKFGFQITDMIENYYGGDIDPPHCYVLSKKLSDEYYEQVAANAVAAASAAVAAIPSEVGATTSTEQMETSVLCDDNYDYRYTSGAGRSNNASCGGRDHDDGYCGGGGGGGYDDVHGNRHTQDDKYHSYNNQGRSPGWWRI